MATNVQEDEDEQKCIEKMVQKQNRKNKKSGGFQSMGLNKEIFNGILKKGYRVPTPIQRKTIPLILEGRDVVAMARTGSGKTACFLIPLFQKLKARQATSGSRALILSPTKELALQTKKFTYELGKFTGIKSACILGGEAMEKQFSIMHGNPDIIIATPGRFVHICVEMGLKLNAIEYVVFDEADRLFEMGFEEQLREILGRLPDARQTVLFSATLPKLLVDFAKAGLSDPTLVRLDADTKIPETLKLAFFHCRSEGKSATLLHLLKHVIPDSEEAVVFCATRHHVEYLHLLLDSAGISNTFIYSHLDATARKINAAKFQNKKARVLLVTDLAARGIDIPLLDNVVNFNFPSQSKLFVHRVGRVARAGRSGTAYSLIAGDEMAYFIDLQLFLGQNVSLVSTEADQDWHNKVGEVPQRIYDDYSDQILAWHSASLELRNMKEVSDRGYAKYLKSRPGASHESVRRSKKLKSTDIPHHPLLIIESNSNDDGRTSLLEQIRNFKPPSTIFEIGSTAKNARLKNVMAKKRNQHEMTIGKFKEKRDALKEESESDEGSDIENDAEKKSRKGCQKLEQSSTQELTEAFKNIVETSKTFRPDRGMKKKKVRKIQKDEENYIGYQSNDFHAEAGYSLKSSFDAAASGAVLDLTGDDDATQKAKKNVMKWDAKKKRYVRSDVNDKKKIKTESGVWIPASYKSNRYEKWKERSKLAHQEEEDDGDDGQRGRKRGFQGLPSGHPAMKKARNAVPKHKKGPKFEIKRPEQVLKQRKLNEKKRQKNTKKGGGGGGRGRKKRN